MNYRNQNRSQQGMRKLMVSRPTLSSNQYGPENAPAVIKLEKESDGFLKIKVESDVMAYILYCHYDEFARIQQTYHVAITWSGLDNTVMFCLTSYGDTAQLHLAVQQFLSFYHHIGSSLVAAPLSQHVTNITLHQYHKATYAVKQLHQKAMIKEVKTTGRIALYCPFSDVIETKKTFVSALYSKESSDVFIKSKMGSKSNPQKEGLFKTLPNDKHSQSFTNGKPGSNSLKNVHIKSNSTILPQHVYPPNARSMSRQDALSDDGIISNYDRKAKRPPLPAPSRPRYSEDGSSTSNSSSGYGSSGGTISRYHRPKHSKNEYFDTAKREILPPIPQQTSPLSKFRPQKMGSLPKKLLKQRAEFDFDYYYDDIQHSGETLSPEHILNYVKETYYHHKTNYSPTNTLDRRTAISPMSHPLHMSPLPQKPSFIPKLETPFRFMQHHKKCFEVTTPIGVTIEVHEGDVTDADCDVIVNVTNSQLHINGELAWAVAKYGLFEIPKLTKLHVAMNGPVMESKVVATPSVGLQSTHIIHAVAPKWNRMDVKKSKKMLHSTYKNIFNEVNQNLGASSIALPVIGLEKSPNLEECYPFHIATEVMYQSLVAFLKTGATALRHIRYIDNDPDHVNLIVTSIKPKIENVTYDSRFVQQHRHNTRTLKSQSSYSDSNRDSCSSPERNMVSPTAKRMISPIMYGRYNVPYDEFQTKDFGRPKLRY